MKKFWTAALCSLVCLAALPTATAAIGEILEAGAGTPVIDGIKDTVWKTASEQEFTHAVAGDFAKDGKKPSSCGAEVSALWDDGAIYFLIEMQDNDYLANEGEYGADTLTVYVDEADYFGPLQDEGQVGFTVTPVNGGAVEVFMGTLGEGSEVAYHLDETGCTIEIKYVPTIWKPAMDNKVLVDFCFNDVYESADGARGLGYRLTWSDELNEGHLDSSNWSYLVCSSAGTGSGTSGSSAREVAHLIDRSLISGYKFVSGSDGHGDEDADKLFDNDVHTKLCTPEKPVEAIVQLDRAYYITGVIMATANDNENYPGRAPGDWEIQGSRDGKKWTTIVSGDESFFDVINFTYFGMAIDPTEESYRFIRFINRKSDDENTQMSELLLCGVKSSATKEELEAIRNPVIVEPLPAEDIVLLPIVYRSGTAGSSTEAIAAPSAPADAQDGLDSYSVSAIVIGAFAVILLGLCGGIVLAQSKKNRA